MSAHPNALASRLEEDTFEVALFGRVSSGKSSLLNALLGTNILPVGVNPITAVPTKLRYGKTPSRLQLPMEMTGPLRTSPGRRIGSQGLSPSRETREILKNLVRAVMEVPSPRLKGGILLVDTPGLG